jgi:multidrug efflux system outer membrane protein
MPYIGVLTTGPRTFRLLAAGLIAAGLAGCATPPERTEAATAPAPLARWAAAPETSGRGVDASWLKSFRDARLAEVVKEALDRNYDLKSLAARVAAAEATARIEGAGRKPQLDFAAGLQHARLDLKDTAFSRFTALFGLSWEIDLWGRIRAAQDAAERDADAVRADAYGARLSLAANTARTWFELAEARLQTDVAEQSVRERRTIAELVRGRFSRGLTRGLDLSLALTDVANAEAQLAEARNRVQNTARRLETLLGRYPAGTLEAEARLPEPPEPIAAGLPGEVLERRPDVVAAFERLRAADARLASARKALLPRITLAAAGGTRSPNPAELVDPRAAAWNLAGGLAQPILNGGRLRNDIERNAAEAEAALNRYRDTVLNAWREAETALAAETRLREQERALAEAVRRTEASQKFAVHSYRQGFIEILTLLDSYRGTLNARSAHLAVRRQLLDNRIGLYLALGGGV